MLKIRSLFAVTKALVGLSKLSRGFVFQGNVLRTKYIYRKYASDM